MDLKTDNKVVLVVPQDQNAPARYSECGRGDVTAAFWLGVANPRDAGGVDTRTVGCR